MKGELRQELYIETKVFSTHTRPAISYSNMHIWKVLFNILGHTNISIEQMKNAKAKFLYANKKIYRKVWENFFRKLKKIVTNLKTHHQPDHHFIVVINNSIYAMNFIDFSTSDSLYEHLSEWAPFESHNFFIIYSSFFYVYIHSV